MATKRKNGRSGGDIAPAAPSTELALPTITRSQSTQILKARAAELYQEARAAQQAGIARFESEYGRADRIDHSLLADLQKLQMRFAAIAARQHRHGYAQEPKVNKFVDALGDVIGKVTVHLATENALELFAPINEQDYLGYAGRVGPKGYDETVLARYRIVDDPSGAVDAAPSRDDDTDDSVCLHENIEAFEDEPTRGTCNDCGAEFDLSASDQSAPVVVEATESIA
jgi:hypothetical protein